MIREFGNLTSSETELMLKAPVLVCILIAGADGTIDKKEIKEAIAQTQKQHKAALADYLKEVSQDFEDKLKILMQSYPHESTQRNPMLMAELGQLNAIWKKMDARFSTLVYQMLIELAAKVAGSSGGILGMNTVTDEDAKYLQLATIQDPSKV
ncbi:MAG TPA: hypothetical protein VK666_25530 [Chryseolinea sp.]|nr:hypothetical protein [Chryseolinea sp.]